MEHDAASMFERYASRGALLELYDRAVEEREGRNGPRGTLERRAALTERLGFLAKMRRGFQDQQAEGLMTLPELRELLAEMDEEKSAISDELRAAEDEAATTLRIEAACEALARAAWYDPVHADWEADPDAVMPSEYLSLAASPEEIRRAYNRYGAQFAVDAEGALTLALSLDLEEVGTSLQGKRTSLVAATP